MNKKIIRALNESISNNIKVAYITVTKSTGSAPGRVGNTMLVFSDGSIEGTVGGGKVEYSVIKEAVKCIEDSTSKPFSYTLNEQGEIGMICGGYMEGFIDVVKNDKNLVIIGGGHIGSFLYNIALELGFNITVVDERIEFANSERFPNADVVSGEYSKVLKKLNVKDSYIVITTKGHSSDYEALKEVVGKDYRYLGLIGSKRKINTLMKQAVEDKLNVIDNDRLFSPIGLDIAKNDPAEIALSIMAEILLIKNGGSLKHLNIKR
jgi:xanthine dehydrogenase accessory factor